MEFKNNSKYDNLPCLIILVVFTLQFGFAQAKIDEEPGQNSITTLDDCNVIWDSPSKNSLGSMPAGNGDIGINLWVEENGDLLFFPRCDKKILLITRKNRKT